MDLQQPISVKELAKLIHAKVHGDEQVLISSVNEIHKVKRGSVVFVDHPKFFDRAIYSLATAIIVPNVIPAPDDKVLLVVDNPFKAYNYLARHFSPYIALNSTISDTAVIGEDTIIEPGAVIGHGVKIGKNCIIKANVVIGDLTEIGDNVIIHYNAVIGSDAFYFQKRADGSRERWHSIGRVILEDDVEIGACTTIDRGVSGDTIIGQGTKMDNHVHIGHGVVIGKNCLLAAHVGIAGKTILQDGVILWGQVGVSKNLVVGMDAEVMAQTGIHKSIQGGKKYFGTPVAEARERYKELYALQRLPQLLRDWDRMFGNAQNTEEQEEPEMEG